MDGDIRVSVLHQLFDVSSLASYEQGHQLFLDQDPQDFVLVSLVFAQKVKEHFRGGLELPLAILVEDVDSVAVEPRNLDQFVLHYLVDSGVLLNFVEESEVFGLQMVHVLEGEEEIDGQVYFGLSFVVSFSLGVVVVFPGRVVVLVGGRFGVAF